MNLALPTILTAVVTVIFLTLERLLPGRELPNSEGWYARVLAMNLCQLAITLATNKIWISLLGGFSFFQLKTIHLPVFEGFIGWFVGTFFFYWWHRLRHKKYFWQLFHQLHHSPQRIEALTSFYKHPIEILADSALSAFVLYVVLGVSLEGAFWFNFFAATGEYFYHSNLKSPKWLKHIIQTPELHSIHHQLDVHQHNFGDLPIWDKLFGTYKDTNVFADKCGFPNNNEKKIWQILMFKDVYHDEETTL